MFKNRIHATLIAFGKPCPVSDLFRIGGRELLERLEIPEPWRQNLATALVTLDELDERIDACEAELRILGADHPYVTLLQSIPGVAWVLGFTIASEIGDITRFAPPRSSAATRVCAHASSSPAPKTTADR